MKKTLALLLALVMVLSFAACSSNDEEKLDHIRGTVDGSVYTNDVAGISFTAPDGWAYLSDDELAALYNLSASELLPEETAEALEETDMVYDMYCQNPNTGASININFENIGLVYGKLLDEQSYMEISQTNLEESLSGSGMEVTSCELITANVNGKDVPCIDIVINMTGYGIDLYEKIFVKKVGDFMGCITIGALTEEELDQIIAGLDF